MQKKIKLIASSWNKYAADMCNIVGRNEKVRCYTDNKPNSWITIEFINLKIKPTIYSLRAGHVYHLRNWNLLGIADGKK